MGDAIRQDFTLFRGEDRVITITMDANGSISGWTSQLYLRAKATEAGDPLLTLDGSVQTAGSSTTPGVLAFTITAAQSLALDAGRLYFAAKRTNAGYKRALVYGVATVKNDAEHEP